MDIHYKISTHPVLRSEERKTVRMQITGLMLRKFTPIRSSRNLNLGKLSVSLERIRMEMPKYGYQFLAQGIAQQALFSKSKNHNRDTKRFSSVL